MSTPKLNEERHFAEWVDRTAMRVLENSGDGDDVAERIEKSTRHRRFPSLDEAKAWMQVNVSLDEYENPRVETMCFMCDDPDGDWPVWTSIAYQEWSDDQWTTVPS